MEAVLGGLISAGLHDFDVPGLAGELFGTFRETSVDQAFERRFAEIDYRIQRQQLHREDIRDLVELTVGRMDVYHVVGTLLLAFCLGWYTDNAIMDSDLPNWYVALFFISNFTAVGFLTFSVWLAMHASVVSQSIGVRLLTSFARLSIPSREQISKIKVSIVPWMDQFLKIKQRILGSLAGSRLLAQSTARSSGMLQVTDARQPVEVPPEVPDDADHGNDDQRHFRRFLKEQPRWLAYDAYSRMCMSAGMNQMLQALSYYILGVIWKRRPEIALTSFLAVKFLGFLLLRLDVAEGQQDVHDRVAFLFFYSFPPILAAGLLYMPFLPVRENLLAAACFFLHAAWLMYILYETKEGSALNREGSETQVMGLLPSRLRTVGYLNVLNLEQRTMAESVRMHEGLDNIQKLQMACEQLHHAMSETMKQERAQAAVSASLRSAPALCMLRDKLEARVLDARSGSSRMKPDLAAEVDAAVRALDLFAVWQKAPEILISLEALRNRAVQGWLKDEERARIENSYQAFLAKCRDLDLGIWLLGEEQEETQVPRDSDALEAMPVASGERAAVRVEAFADLVGLPQSVWIDTEDDALLHRDPALGKGPERSATSQSESSQSDSRRYARVTSYRDTIFNAMPEWSSNASQVTPRDSLNIHAHENAAEQPAERGTGATREQPAWMPKDGTPPDDLPCRTVRQFTLGIAGWWVLAGFMFFGLSLWDLHKPSVRTRAVRRVDAAWPEPAAFFNVRGLTCNTSRILMQGKFAMYSAERYADTLGVVTDLGTTHVSSVVVCREGACDVLSPSGDGSSWRLLPLGHVAGTTVPVDTVRFEIPPTWRAITAAWEPCSAGTCSKMWLAAWDGTDVVLATAQPGPGEGPGPGLWAVRVHFQVDKRQGRCPRTPSACDTFTVESYRDVVALQLGDHGRTLVILHGNGTILDGWDLAAGELLRQQRLDTAYSAMCHDEDELMFTRPGRAGPILEAMPLSEVLGPLAQHKAVPAAASLDDAMMFTPALRGASWQSMHSG